MSPASNNNNNKTKGRTTMKKLLVGVLASASLMTATPVLDAATAAPAVAHIEVKAQPEVLVHPSYRHWYYNVERWHSTAISAGWSETQWYRLSQIIYRESRGNPYAFNRYDCCGGSLGLTQINGVHWNWMMRAGLISYPWQLTNAWRNLRAAKALYNRAGWSPWY